MGFFCLLMVRKGRRNPLSFVLGLFSWCQASAESSVKHWHVLKAMRWCNCAAIPSHPVGVVLWGDSVRTTLGDRQSCCQRPHPKCQNSVFWYKQEKEKIRILFIYKSVERRNAFFFFFLMITHSGKRYMWEHLTDSKHIYNYKADDKNTRSICNGKKLKLFRNREQINNNIIFFHIITHLKVKLLLR